ncbi:MAG: flagellar hook-basal body complex protein FliE [Acidobacteriia bacterium]|nr:flagellar hook-basal body complex protein FliE [Terriglobia bacterium]
MVDPIQGFSTTAAVTPATGAAAPAPAGDASPFFQTLDGMIQQVGDMQATAQQQVTELLQGNGQDLHSAMIAVEKADLSFQLMMQVRNKIIQAYQTISQMQF